MTRVKRGHTARHRRQKKLKIIKGFRGHSLLLFKNANQYFLKSFQNAFVDRRLRKRYFRRLWITRINAQVRHLGLNYQYYIFKNKSLNRKILAQLTLLDLSLFDSLDFK